jgi:hypothetical protein
MAALNLARDLAPGIAGRAHRGSTRGRAPDHWTVFWRGFRIFVLGRDRIDRQYAGWRQEYARYFRVRSLHKARL